MMKTQSVTSPGHHPGKTRDFPCPDTAKAPISNRYRLKGYNKTSYSVIETTEKVSKEPVRTRLEGFIPSNPPKPRIFCAFQPNSAGHGA